MLTIHNAIQRLCRQSIRFVIYLCCPLVQSTGVLQKKSFREFAELNQKSCKSKCATLKALEQIEADFPDIAIKYFDLKFPSVK